MTRSQSLERIADVLKEQDQLKEEFAAVKKDFKRRREILANDLSMCRANLDQMTLEEVEE